MRAAAVILLLVLVLLLALPLGMASMDLCPACVLSGQGVWGVCLAILSLVSLAVPRLLATLRGRAAHLRPLLLVSIPEKPPRAS